jgi:hypothetical protein
MMDAVELVYRTLAIFGILSTEDRFTRCISVSALVIL